MQRQPPPSPCAQAHMPPLTQMTVSCSFFLFACKCKRCRMPRASSVGRSPSARARCVLRCCSSSSSRCCSKEEKERETDSRMKEVSRQRVRGREGLALGIRQRQLDPPRSQRRVQCKLKRQAAHAGARDGTADNCCKERQRR